MSNALFGCHYELKRHMESYEQAKYPCTVYGCDRVGGQAFTRKDKLVKHKREEHEMAI